MSINTQSASPLAIVAGVLFAVAACSGDAPTSPGSAPPPVASVAVTPAAPSIFVGDTLRLIAVPRSSSGAPLMDRAVTWASSDTLRATVSASGTVRARTEGVVRVTATSEGMVAQVDLAIDPIPAATVVADVVAFNILEGFVTTVQATVFDSLGRTLEGRTITWTSDDATVATVSPAGVVTAVLEGTTRIVARHGALADTIAVRVRAVFAADLLFDVSAGDGMLPRTYRADLMTELTTDVFGFGGAWQATPSPDGTRIAFTCISEGAEGPTICTAKRDGTDLQVLTDGDAASEDQPAWSPDGTRIAYRRWPHGATPGQFNPTDIWVIDAEGTDAVNVTADALVQAQPAWSPQPVNGAYRIVFSQESIVDGQYVTSRLHTIRADGTDRQTLTPAGVQLEEDPTWSPDGGTVVFVRSNGFGTGEIHLVDVVTRTTRAFLASPIQQGQQHPSWSPDGRYLAFTSAHEPGANGDFRRQVYTARADGTGLARRTTSESDKDHLAWLPRQ